MRIAYVLGRFPVLSETFIGNEIRAMEAAGHEIVLIALHKPEGAFQPEDAALMRRTLYFTPIDPSEGRRLIWRSMLRIPYVLPFLLCQTTEPYFPFLVHAAHLAEYIRQQGCSHIHAHFAWGAAAYAIGAAKLAGVPVTFTCHGSDVYARPVDLAAKCTAASAVIAVAASIARDVRHIARETPCETIYCGVDMRRFRPLAEGAPHNGRWLFAGRLIDCKGIEDILAAWARLPEDIRPPLDVVGDGPLREGLESYVERYGLQEYVQFLGMQQSSWLARNGPHYCAFIAAFRQGRDGSRDTAPMVLKEAMAMGLPIVTTDFADITSLVDADCALLCAPGSPDALAQAVMRMQTLAPEARQKMAIAARVRAVCYTVERQAERLNEIFCRIAK